MRLYTVHIRPVAGDDDPDVVFVPEGFSWLAFALAPLYALWHREWLGLAVYLAVAVGLAFPLQAIGMSEAAQAMANVALSLIVGWHAGDWRRWRLGRRGYRLATLVAGRRAADAEYRFFTNWRFSRPTPLPALNLLTP
jgi:hypothetical protein